MKRTIKFRNLSGGLRLAGDAADEPRNILRRNRGMHPISENIFETRDGSTQLHAVNDVHSLTYYNDTWYAAASTLFYREAVQVKSGLSGDRLSFTRMSPTAGKEDYLFCAGGDGLFKAGDEVVDGTELVTNGTMEADANWANTTSAPATNERSTTQFFNGDYSRKFTPDAADEGIKGDTFTSVSGAQYRVTAWVYPDDGTTVKVRVYSGGAATWIYNTSQTGLTQDTWNKVEFVYTESTGGAAAFVQFDSGTSTSGDWYVDDVSIQRAYYTTTWGIVPPIETLAAADGGAGGSLDDGAVYKYRVTFFNTKTGTRSNAAADSPDSYTKLLCHCEGADQSTTLIDSSASAHTSTNEGTAKIVTAQQKFDSASALFDGNSDYFTFPDHVDWNYGNDPFTIDFWARFNSVAATTGFFNHETNAANRYFLFWDKNDSTLNWRVYTEPYAMFFPGPWSPAADTWYHVAIIRGWGGNADTWSLCVNGSSIATDMVPIGMPDLAGVFEVGREVSTIFFNGWLDEFRVSKGIARWTENFTAPTAAYGSTTIDLGGGNTSVDLTDIPVSSDPQVSSVELWRTSGGGTLYFSLTQLVNGTTTYTDNISDDELGSTELPIDNAVPYAWFDECIGPINASMFWLTRSQIGERGRVYYSPIGRAEAMDGFIEVASDDHPLQAFALYGGEFFVVGEAGWYQIAGRNPYFSRIVAGAPGTTKPHTVVVTPFGIMYEAEDGVRLFNGSTSVLVSTKRDIQRIFRGKTGGGLTAFSGVVAAYGRDEYVISDETQLIAFDVTEHKWRDIGDLAIKSLHYAKDADIIGAGTNADGIYDLEKEGDTQDNTTDIERDIETNFVRLADDKTNIVLHVHVDYEMESN